MELWQIVLLGIIQGLTEFLPVSSTAHLLVAQELMGRSREELKDDPFTIVIQLGTLAAVYWYFRTDIVILCKAFFRDVMEGRLLTSATPEGRMAKQIIVGTVPVVVIGGLFSSWLKDTFNNPLSMASVAITFSVLMAAAEVWSAWRRRAGQPERGEKEMTYFDALWIGSFQALALMPGGSRSGTTITAGLFRGLTRAAAARFSFLLSLPSVLAAGVKSIYDWLKAAHGNPELQDKLPEQAIAMLIGTAISAVIGYVAIAWLLRYLNSHSMLVFVGYRIVLGLAILGLIAGGILRP
jgi:undecaprenyl-diphosphatase